MNWLLKRTKGDPIIWTVIILLSIFGVLAVYSSTSALAYVNKGGNTEFYLLKHVGFLVFGLFLMYLAHLVDYRYYSRIAQLLLYLAIPLLLYTLFFGTEINSARRWITIPGIGITMQTSDLGKLALIMYVARFLSRKQEDIKDFKRSFLPILGAITTVCLLIAPADLSTASVLFATCLLIMFIGRINMSYIALLFITGVVAISLLIFGITSSNAPGRIQTWKNRIENYTNNDGDGGSYQSKQAKIAIANGGIIGRGPGKSTQKYFLPNPYADFIFAIILEEYGLAFGVIIIILYLTLLMRCIRIVIRSPKAFGALLAVGLSFSLVIQAFIHMGVSVGIFPVTGLALPLISMGGTTTIFTSLALGIILSVSRNIEDATAPETEVQKGGNIVTA